MIGFSNAICFDNLRLYHYPYSRCFLVLVLSGLS